MKKYSCWGVAGIADLFVEGIELSEQMRSIEGPEVVLIKIFEATCLNDALRQYHKFQGWEPYKPMLDENGNEYPEDNE